MTVLQAALPVVFSPKNYPTVVHRGSIGSTRLGTVPSGTKCRKKQ